MARDLAAEATTGLFARILETPAVQALARRVEAGGVLSVSGVTPAAQPFLAALLHDRFKDRPLVVVTEGLKAQETFFQDATTWIEVSQGERASGTSAAPWRKGASNLPVASEARVLFFYPSWENLPHESKLPHSDVISDRLETLVVLDAIRPTGPEKGSAKSAGRSKLHRTLDSGGRHSPLIVSSVQALMQRTLPPDTVRNRTRQLKRGDRLEPLDFVEWLEAQGYEPEAQVTQKGEIALRGGILDLFPPTSPWPVRLEFFGDELESLREFDPLTQVSRNEIVAVTIPPAGELGLLKQLTSAPMAQPTVKPASFLDHLPAGAILLLCEPEALAAQADEYARQVPAQDPFFIGWPEFQEEAAQRGVILLRVTELAALETLPEQLPVESLEAYRPVVERVQDPQVAEAQRREFFSQLHRWSRQGKEVRVFCNNDGERKRFEEIVQEYGLAESPASPENDAATEAGGGWQRGLQVGLGTLARGFLFEAGQLVVVTDAEIFGRYRVQRPRRLRSPHAQATRSALDIDFTDLEEGDYVVHLQHGIGRYAGLQVLPPGAGTKGVNEAERAQHLGQECLVLEYAAADPSQPAPKLYVPVTEAHLVSKYVGTGKARPPLNTLGGTRWAKAREHAERAVRDVASELLAIQAARESQAGHAFAADTAWQREFEGAFLYEETPDQLRAILETKQDMERTKPMDRLICGDVGFGKTEVGIRAAFKAVMDGKQVAVLVPTTVLAQQHFNTFRERMADYPIRIELLSRFRTRREQNQVIRDLAAGAVDIVIGTHRLLQSDIGFKDLALVVVDEEQRFGVVHKEKFKLLRRLVDVLTLSATPIPRTLYLALTGARDMSTIQTPPHDRLPVETIVTQYDERVIRDAIQREMNRGGQVFFLHNRVMTIETMAAKVRTLLPQARVIVGHGQMDSDTLEEVMTRFVNGEADVLLSTTIIESGLDIPNANTIIIDRADRFGLSDLYQLRGRVGRYKHQAYAYLLLPRHAGLVADVRKRLSAIKQYSTLGSGFKIAMRDLEIRGAGNLLGSEQSGHITAVGFELYCQLLKQSVAALKGEKVQRRIEVDVRLDFLASQPAAPDSGDSRKRRGQEAPGVMPEAQGGVAVTSAAIPFQYIAETRQRIEVYRKLAQVDELASLEKLEQELRDRFGPVPSPVRLLMEVAHIKLLAAERGISSVEVKEDKLILTRNQDLVMVGGKFPRLTGADAAARLQEIKRLLRVL